MKFLENRSDITQDFIVQHILSNIHVQPQQNAEIPEIGCENIAIDFGNIIVRLPRDENALENLKFESALCAHIKVDDLETPKTSLVQADYPFSWHKKIQGDYFLEEIYNGLRESQKDKAAKKLATLFYVMHQIPIQDAKQLGAKNLPEYISSEKMRSLASQYVPEDLRETFDIFIEQYEALEFDSYEPVLGYFDAHAWNMAFDKEKDELIGVYDFADCAFGDLHQDFHPLNTISQDLMLRVIEFYEEMTGVEVDRNRVNIYTWVAEFSDLFEIAEGKTTLMQKSLDHHCNALRKWQEKIALAA